MEAFGLLLHGFVVLMTWKTLALMMVGLGTLTWRQSAKYRDAVTLYESTLAENLLATTETKSIFFPN